MDNTAMQQSRLIPMIEWNQYHEWPTVSALRNIVARADIKGFTNVVVRANGRVLIDEQAFFDWVETQNYHARNTRIRRVRARKRQQKVEGKPHELYP